MKKIKIEGDGWLPANHNLKVTRLEMLLIVRQWYLVKNPHVLIGDMGYELDEFVEMEIEDIYNQEKESK